MKIVDSINSFFRGKKELYRGAQIVSFGGWSCEIGAMPFADAIFVEIVELLTDLTQDVSWRFAGNNTAKEVAFDRFFKQYAKVVMYKLFRDGVVVIGHTQQGEGVTAFHELHICTSSEYTTVTKDGFTVYNSNIEGLEVYPMETTIHQMTGQSHYQLVRPYRELLDNALNASNTVCKRLGAMVIGSPKNGSAASMPIELDEEEKKTIEKEIQESYGALNKQNQFMVMSREMAFQVVSLASLDLKTNDRVRTAVLAIADCVKVPANQIAMIDANSSKSLSNGSELREGDFNKYQSFERFLDQTFVQLARDCRLEPGATDIVEGSAVKSYYVIYNKPKAAQAQTA